LTQGVDGRDDQPGDGTATVSAVESAAVADQPAAAAEDVQMDPAHVLASVSEGDGTSAATLEAEAKRTKR
jgi:hypothetical protein